jgi:hypothetical protein
MLQNPPHVPHTSALSGVRQRVTKVRILFSPPHSLGCRENAELSAPKYTKMPVFVRFPPQSGLKRMNC